MARLKSSNRAGYNIGILLDLSPTKGDVGLEIEVEGNVFPKTSTAQYPAYKPELIPKGWEYHRDGSLRGQDNAEYVLKKPILFKDVEKSVTDLWNMFSKCGSILDESNRTSVHVHLNVQEWHLNRLASFCALYFSVEEMLTAWCGEARVGNLFCLRAKDAPAIVTKLSEFIRTDGDQRFSEAFHYAGFNAHALQKFGSIEIRSLRGVTDPTLIIRWVNILRQLYDLSAEYPNPTDVIEGFSSEGAVAFLYRILGAHADPLVNDLKWQYHQIEEAMLRGVRLAQDLCYCRDWSLYKPVTVQPDPFGRAIGKKIQQQALYDPEAVAVPAQPTGLGSWNILNTLGSADIESYEDDEEF